MDPARFTARRVGPLDLPMLERQIECLHNIRMYVPENASHDEDRDALDGAANLLGHLIEQSEYQVQEEGESRRTRMFFHASHAADELAALAALRDEGDDDHDEIEAMLDRFDDVHGALRQEREEELRREREAHVTVTLRIRREWIEQYRAAIGDDGSNDDEHDLLVEIGDGITRFVGQGD